MPTITVDVGLATVNMTGLHLMLYADNYYRAAQRVGLSESKVFDPVPYQLYCQALELRLKAFAWFKDTSLTRNQLRRKYWHDLSKLWADAKANGLSQYVVVSAERDAAIGLIAPYYKDRKFCYTDIVMQFRDADILKQDAGLLQTISDLVEDLRANLVWHITNAS